MHAPYHGKAIVRVHELKKIDAETQKKKSPRGLLHLISILL